MRPNSLELNEFFCGLCVFVSSANVGVIAAPAEKKGAFNIYLVDSGEDDSSAQKILFSLERHFKKFCLKAVIATHCHADHIGGAAYLAQKTGCEIWATQEEKCGIECPQNQGAIICGGFPLPQFRESYYRAKKAFVSKTICEGQTENLGGGFEASFVSLPGHYMQMVGVLAKNAEGKKVFFAGDGIFGRKMLGHYWTPFLYDVASFKNSLKKISKVEADFFVPSHGDACSEIQALVEFNLISTISNEKAIEKILREPRTWEQILKEFADSNGIPLKLSQYALVGSTLRSYLAYLYEDGRVRFFFKDNFMYWTLA